MLRPMKKQAISRINYCNLYTERPLIFSTYCPLYLSQLIFKIYLFVYLGLKSLKSDLTYSFTYAESEFDVVS